jgi:hypothetical protein
MNILKKIGIVSIVVLPLVISGCATKYVTPGGPARLDSIADPDIRKSFAATPEANFPASVVIVRLQSPNYQASNRAQQVPGKYSVITMRDFEEDSHFKRIESQPELADAIALNRLLLPDRLDDETALRAAAAKLHADMLLIYTMDTQFHARNRSKPLTTFSLGIVPTKDLLVSSTASAILVDVRTGFVYGALEGTQSATRNATVWTTTDAVEAARKATEKAAFEQMISEFEPFWKSVVARYRNN